MQRRRNYLLHCFEQLETLNGFEADDAALGIEGPAGAPDLKQSSLEPQRDLVLSLNRVLLLQYNSAILAGSQSHETVQLLVVDRLPYPH